MLPEAATEADVAERVPPTALANADSDTVKDSRVLVRTTSAVLDDDDELLDPAGAEGMVGTDGDAAMNPVALDEHHIVTGVEGLVTMGEMPNASHARTPHGPPPRVCDSDGVACFHPDTLVETEEGLFVQMHTLGRGCGILVSDPEKPKGYRKGTVSCAFTFIVGDRERVLTEVCGNLITLEHMVSRDGTNWISAQDASVGWQSRAPTPSTSLISVGGRASEVLSLHLVGGGSIWLKGGVLVAMLGSRTTEHSPGVYHIVYSGCDLGVLDSLPGAASGNIRCRAGAVMALHDGVPQFDVNLISASISRPRPLSDMLLMILRAPGASNSWHSHLRMLRCVSLEWEATSTHLYPDPAPVARSTMEHTLQTLRIMDGTEPGALVSRTALYNCNE